MRFLRNITVLLLSALLASAPVVESHAALSNSQLIGFGVKKAAATGGCSGCPTQSVNFTAASSQYLSISDANFGAFDKAKFAYSVWYNLNSSSVSGPYQLLAQQDSLGTSTAFHININTSGQIDAFVFTDCAGATSGRLTTTATTFGGSGVWHHLLFWWDSANATAGDRMRLWMDGTEITSFANDNNPTLAMCDSTTTVQAGALHDDSWFMDGKEYQAAVYSGSLPLIGTLYSSGHPLNITGASGLWSVLDVSGGAVTHDGVLGASWTNNNGSTASSTIP